MRVVTLTVGAMTNAPQSKGGEIMDLYGDEILTLREAASLLKTSIPNLKRMIYAGKIRASKLASRWRLRKSEIASYLEINSVRTSK